MANDCISTSASVSATRRSRSDLGYVRRISRNSGYTISSRVLSLSSGFHCVPKVVEITAPSLDKLTSELLWPTSLATLDIDAMVVRYSTIPISPLAHAHSTLNRRLSLASRAHGRAYLAFTSPNERSILLKTMSTEERDDVQRQLPGIRKSGWAVRHPRLDPQTSTIAVPVMVAGRVLATIGVTFFRKAVDRQRQDEIAATLRRTADSMVLEYNPQEPSTNA